MTYETHPLQPFLPPAGRILFLGSFPPPRARWSMDFFYPNFANDFWRVMGLIHAGSALHFVEPGQRRFCRERIVAFCAARGLAFYDTALRVCRLRDNASDRHLEVLEPTDVAALLRQMPHCRAVATTGGRASEAFALQSGLAVPRTGECTVGQAFGRSLRWWRMPSTSRAYPMPLERKAEIYARLFRT